MCSSDLYNASGKGIAEAPPVAAAKRRRADFGTNFNSRLSLFISVLSISLSLVFYIARELGLK